MNAEQQRCLSFEVQEIKVYKVIVNFNVRLDFTAELFLQRPNKWLTFAAEQAGNVSLEWARLSLKQNVPFSGVKGTNNIKNETNLNANLSAAA